MLATNHRNKIWNQEGTLWQDNVKKSPLKARPHNNLGNYLMDNRFVCFLQIDRAKGRRADYFSVDFVEYHYHSV